MADERADYVGGARCDSTISPRTMAASLSGKKRDEEGPWGVPEFQHVLDISTHFSPDNHH